MCAKPARGGGGPREGGGRTLPVQQEREFVDSGWLWIKDRGPIRGLREGVGEAAIVEVEVEAGPSCRV